MRRRVCVPVMASRGWRGIGEPLYPEEITGLAHDLDEVEVAADTMMEAVSPSIAAEAALKVLQRLRVAIVAGTPGEVVTAFVPGRHWSSNRIGHPSGWPATPWDESDLVLRDLGVREFALLLPSYEPVMVETGGQFSVRPGPFSKPRSPL